jgi:hypothetical protein
VTGDDGIESGLRFFTEFFLALTGDEIFLEETVLGFLLRTSDGFREDF